jgi:hypothetical protein
VNIRLGRFNWNWMTENDKPRQDHERVSNTSLNDTGWLLDVANDPAWIFETQWSAFEVGNSPGRGAVQDFSDVEEMRNNTTLDPGANEGYLANEDMHYERVNFVSLQLKKYPEMLYRHGQTPFLHRQLNNEYTSQVLEDVASACALYCGKNAANERVVYGDLSRKARDIAAAQFSLETPLKRLACTQALILYQIIRLFDGDIRQRADAESHEPILKEWTDHLHMAVHPLPTIMSDPSSSEAIASSGWKGWIYQESCRRTILTSHMLQGVYSYLKSGCDNVPCKVNSLSFTAQTALWNAPSEYQWKEMCKEKKQFQVTIREWDTAMDDAKVNDFDDLGLIILAALKGIDFTSQWLGRSREHLEQWGL